MNYRQQYNMTRQRRDEEPATYPCTANLPFAPCIMMEHAAAQLVRQVREGAVTSAAARSQTLTVEWLAPEETGAEVYSCSVADIVREVGDSGWDVTAGVSGGPQLCGTRNGLTFTFCGYDSACRNSTSLEALRKVTHCTPRTHLTLTRILRCIDCCTDFTTPHCSTVAGVAQSAVPFRLCWPRGGC